MTWYFFKPYVRPSPEEHKKKMEMIIADEAKRKREDNDVEEKSENGMSKNKMKKLARAARNPKKVARLNKEPAPTCAQCRNLPVSTKYILKRRSRASDGEIKIFTILQGVKCNYKLCRACCRKKCAEETLTCEGHCGMTNRRREMRDEKELTNETKISETINNSPIKAVPV